MMLIRVVQLLSTAKYDGWDCYEEKYDLSSYSDQYSTGWEDVDEDRLKEIQAAVGHLNNHTNMKYTIIRAYNKLETNDLIEQANNIKKAQEKAAKAREAYNKAQAAEKEEKARARKLKQLEKLKKELNEEGS
jgi:ribosomal protein L12E/L44/L45/RPP1/RPP2